MRAVVLDANGLPELTDLPEPVGAGTLVEITACGLCGSDVEKLGHAPAGTVLGHEIEGRLDDGTRVTVLHRVPCGACDRCLAGHESTCVEFESMQIEPGGFAERLRASHALPLPDAVGDGDGIWVEPLACVLRASRLVPAGRVLVVGCGAIGRLWIQVLRRQGHEVVAVDPRAERLEAARELGAILDDEPVIAAVLTAHPGLDAALARLAPGGTLVVFAAPPGTVPIALEAVYRRELTMAGSRSATPEFFRAAVELLPQVALPELTTLPLERFAEGVELYRSGQALKVVFTP